MCQWLLETGLHGRPELSKCEALTQCWFDVGLASQTLAQHQTNIGSVFRIYCVICTIITVQPYSSSSLTQRRIQLSTIRSIPHGWQGHITPAGFVITITVEPGQTGHTGQYENPLVGRQVKLVSGKHSL